jgi:hypothetical protein
MPKMTCKDATCGLFDCYWGWSEYSPKGDINTVPNRMKFAEIPGICKSRDPNIRFHYINAILDPDDQDHVEYYRIKNKGRIVLSSPYTDAAKSRICPKNWTELGEMYSTECQTFAIFIWDSKKKPTNEDFFKDLRLPNRPSGIVDNSIHFTMDGNDWKIISN